MSALKTHKSFYIKDARGKLILLSELSLLAMLKDNALKPSTKVFNKELGTWMKISELNIYSNRSSIDFSEIEQSELDIEEAPQDDSSLKIIQLLDSVEDAKEAIYNARFEGLEKSKKIAIQNNELKAQLSDASIKIHSYELENKALQDRIKILQDEKVELLELTTYGNTEVENSKLKAQNNKLKQQLKLVELDYKNEIEINNNLIIQIEGLKKEAIELYERKEFHETQFNKIDKERVHFQENVQLYKTEIHHLNHDRQQIQEQYNKLLQRHEEYLNKDNEYKEKYVESAKTISELKNAQSKYSKNLSQLKDLVREKDKEIYQLKDKLEGQYTDLQNVSKQNDELTRQLLYLEQQLANHKTLINDLRDMPPTPGGVEVVELLQNEVAHLKNLVKNKDEQLRTLRAEFVALKNSCVAMKTFEDTEKKLKNVEISYNAIFKKAKTLALKWRHSQNEVLTLTKELTSLKQMQQEEKPLVVMSKDNVHDQPIAKDVTGTSLELVQDDITQPDLRLDEILKENSENIEPIAGKRFELDDSRIWKINHPQLSNKLFTIFELKEFIENYNIDREINVKSLGRSWKKISKTLELNTHIIVEEIDGVQKYFIERKNVRVPTYNRVQVMSDNQIADATCIDVSQGGCFLEFPRLPGFIKNEQEIALKLFIHPESTIVVNCVIKNVVSSLEKFGVGLMFKNRPKELSDWITDKIQQFTSEMDIKEAS